jgi:high-affinity iron transporter
MISPKKNQLTKILLFSLLSIAAFGIIENIQYSYAQSTNSTAQGNDTSTSDVQQTPLEFIDKIKGLLAQTIAEYTNGNYTGAEELATTAYLDNYEYVEAPLAKIDKPLMETTEVMMREELRQMILDQVPLEDLKEHIDKINENLDKSIDLLSRSN